MKKIQGLLIGSFLSTSMLHAMTYEYPSIYKDPVIMGMGGTNIAVGGRSSSLFHNPAGLSQLNPDEGLEIDLINVNIAYSENTLSLLDDMDAATTSAQTFAVLEKYQGSNNHITLNDYSSVAYKYNEFGFSIGVLPLSVQLNFQTHALGSSAGLLDINGYMMTGYVAGLSYDWDDALSVGLGFKSLSGKGINGSLTLSQVLDLTSGSSDTTTYLEDNFMSDFSASSFDLGAMYNLERLIPNGSYWYPMVAVSIMDVGDTTLGNYGTIPMTVNLGLSVKPDFSFLSDWIFAIDYIDLLNAYDTNYDADMAKKWRLGATASVINNSFLQLTGSIGMYNANYTFGLEGRFGIVTVIYTSYAEAIGAYADQNIDRRNSISLAIGW